MEIIVYGSEQEQLISLEALLHGGWCTPAFDWLRKFSHEVCHFLNASPQSARPATPNRGLGKETEPAQASLTYCVKSRIHSSMKLRGEAKVTQLKKNQTKLFLNCLGLTRTI